MASAAFENLAGLWLQKVDLGAEYKKREFDHFAEIANLFYDGNHSFLYGARSGDIIDPSVRKTLISNDALEPPDFCMSVNKVAELVQLLLPMLYHKVPNRRVAARSKPAIPLELLQSLRIDIPQEPSEDDAIRFATVKLLEWYLNYTPREMNLREETRRTVTEAIIKGMGIMWCEVVKTPLGIEMPKLVHDSIDNFVCDPDAERFDDAMWVARKRCWPVWQVEQHFNLPSDVLQGHKESLNARAENDSRLADGEDNYDRKVGGTNDTVEFYEIYSRMGLGGRLKGMPEEHREVLDSFGDYVYLAVCKGYKYPLNAPAYLFKESMSEDQDTSDSALEELEANLQWQTPFWMDETWPWPFALLNFHYRPNKLYPMGHVTPAIGELTALDWIASFAITSARNNSRMIIGVDSELDDKGRDVLESGASFSIVDTQNPSGKSIDQMVSVLKFPNVNSDLWKAQDDCERRWEQRTGANAILYGAQPETQPRSSAEVQLKQQNSTARLDDLNQQQTEFSSRCARMEAIAAAIHLHPKHFALLVGEPEPTTQITESETGEKMAVLVGAGPLTQLWNRAVFSRDLRKVVGEFAYTIEEGTSTRPDKAQKISNIDQSAQYVVPMFTEIFKMTNDPSQLNAWMRIWAESRDVEDINALMVRPLPPPPAPPPGPPQQQQGPPQQNGQPQPQGPQPAA